MGSAIIPKLAHAVLVLGATANVARADSPVGIARGRLEFRKAHPGFLGDLCCKDELENLQVRLADLEKTWLQANDSTRSEQIQDLLTELEAAQRQFDTGIEQLDEARDAFRKRLLIEATICVVVIGGALISWRHRHRSRTAVAKP
jgi:hypothetical protein